MHGYELNFQSILNIKTKFNDRRPFNTAVLIRFHQWWCEQPLKQIVHTACLTAESKLPH